MPKASVKATPKSEGSLLVLKTAKKRVIIPRPKTYAVSISDFVNRLDCKLICFIISQDALASAARHYPHIALQSIILQTRDLDICAGELAEISEESWKEISTELRTVEVKESVQAHVVPTPASTPNSTYRDFWGSCM
jgi:hypothetical protein